MIRVLLIISCWLCFASLHAQTNVSGSITTTNGQPAAAVNVLLLNTKDSAFIKGTISDPSGAFLLSGITAGEYLLRFSMVGYRTMYSFLQITGTDRTIHTGIHRLEAEEGELETIVIRSEKLLYQQKPEGIIVNVADNVLTRGSTALEVLTRSPGVTIDQRNNNIYLNGKSGVTVMMDGKAVRMPVEQVVVFLNGMSANDIDKIELLSMPPAGYDADGSAGVINIQLRKNKKKGTSGSGSFTTGYGKREKFMGSATLNHASEKINIYSSLTYSYNRTYSEMFIASGQHMPFMGGDVYMTAEDTSRVFRTSRDIVLGMDIMPGKNMTLGANVTNNASKGSALTVTDAEYNVLPDSLLSFRSRNHNINRWNNSMVAVFLEKKWSDAQKFNFNTDYLIFSNKLSADVGSSFTDKHGNKPGTDEMLFAPMQKGFADTRIKVAVFTASYSNRLSEKLKIETGVKTSVTRNKSVSGIQSFVNENWVESEQTSNNILMKEQVYAAYTSLTAAVSSTIQAVIGVRYEYSDTHMDNAATGEKITARHLGKLFPNIFLSKKIQPGIELQLSYTRRISRPSYNDLASYVGYSDPTAVYTGNPLLKPTITDNLKVGLSTKKYSLSLLYSKDHNAISRFQITESPNKEMLFISPQNLPKQVFLTMQLMVPVAVNEWWKMHYSFTGGLRHYEVNHTKQPFTKSYFGYSTNFNQQLILPAGFSAEISGWYNSRSFDGSKRLGGFFILNAGIKKELKKNAGVLQLTASDILGRERYFINYGTLTEEAFSIRNTVDVRTESTVFPIIKLSYSRSFGAVKKENKQRNTTQEESSRVIRE
ncbi:MAG: TonB-dependent receptor [Chitinophagaceae bacterium]|nr:TonB-dependent receptor [Chitinophagaceae bacterium]MCW5927739.1 TonB-dependent receptor [Chitinophagaceae bacterium]